MKTIFKTIACLSLLVSVFSLKAQEDKISGIYVDGVKVTGIDCYSFGEMEVIFPIDKLKGFDKVAVRIECYSNGSSDYWSAKRFSQPALELNSFSHNSVKYTKIKVFTKNENFSLLNEYAKTSGAVNRRNDLYIKSTFKKKANIEISIYGKTINGYTDTYSQACNCYVKEPTYETTEFKIFRLETLPNTNGNSEKGNYEIDYGLPCPVKGEKLEELLRGEVQTNNQIDNNTQSTSLNNINNSNTNSHLEKHKNGKVSVQGQFDVNGQHEGTWKYFTEEGKIEKVENYKAGIMHGEWKYYDANGKLIKTEKYNEGELIE